MLDLLPGQAGGWRDEPWDGDVVVKVDAKIFAFLGNAEGTSVGRQVRREP